MAETSNGNGFMALKQFWLNVDVWITCACLGYVAFSLSHLTVEVAVIRGSLERLIESDHQQWLEIDKIRDKAYERMQGNGH